LAFRSVALLPNLVANLVLVNSPVLINSVLALINLVPVHINLARLLTATNLVVRTAPSQVWGRA
jgi:hypothetical protein